MNLKDLKILAQEFMRKQSFDSMALGLVDFKAQSFEVVELIDEAYAELGPVYFDLASLTKPLTFGVAGLIEPALLTAPDLLLLSEHRSGLPIWGRLSREGWQAEIKEFEIKESETAYSDFGALRLQLEIEERLGKSLYDLVSPLWDEELTSWLDLPMHASFAPTGYRARSLIWGEVMDDNAYVIGQRVSHAGLFATIGGVCRTLLNLDQRAQLLEVMSGHLKKGHGRFCRGWDTTGGNQDSLAGKGASELTFGHLGFTGTSIWIDPKLARAYILLTNATQNYWHERRELNEMRRGLGSAIWSI